MSGHTPEKWMVGVISESERWAEIVDSDSFAPVGLAYGKEAERRARLMATAPEMAELLRRHLTVSTQDDGVWLEDDIRALLARIDGSAE